MIKIGGTPLASARPSSAMSPAVIKVLLDAGEIRSRQRVLLRACSEVDPEYSQEARC